MTDRIKPPTDRRGDTHKIVLMGQSLSNPGETVKVTLYATLNRLPDGRPIEMFIKADNGYQGFCDTLAVTVSLALQYGAPLEAILAKWRGQRYEPSQIGVGTSIADAIARWLMPPTEGEGV